MVRVLRKAEIIEKLKKGEVIHWIGGLQPCAFMGINETVRWNTMCKLKQEGIITPIGSSDLSGTLRLKLA